MHKKKTHYQKGLSVPKALALGLLAGWGITLGFSVVIACLISSGASGENMMGPLSVAALIVSSVVVSWIVSNSMENRKLLYCLAGGGVYFVSLLCANVGFYGGTYTGIIYTLLAVMGASLIVGLITSRKRRSKIRY